MNRKVLIFSALLALCGAKTSAQKWYSPAVDQKVDALMKQMTLDEKLKLIGGLDWMHTANYPRLGIPSMKMSDGPQGAGTHGKSTAYPCAVTLTATWNRTLAYDYGTSLARDCRARAVNIILGPAVNIYRAPMCGRNFEYMGEDPYLASRTAVGYITGVQDHGVMAVVKHFCVNNSDYDRHEVSDDVDERTLNEIYFPAFRAAVQEAGVGALMTSYNKLDGIYTTEHPWLLKTVLRDQWGFKGMVMSDWGAAHHSIPSARSGLDLEMPSAKYTNAQEMKYYLTTGDVTMDMIDAKVRHILRTQVGFGFMKENKADQSIDLDNAESAATALKVAQEGMVLLKNKGNLLPLNPKKVKHIIVTGKNATGYVRGGGSGNVNPFHYVDALGGIKYIAKQEGVSVDYMDAADLLPPIVYTDNTLTTKGMKAEYYKNTDITGTPLATRNEKSVAWEWPGNGNVEGLPANNFSARYTGVVCAPKSGDYELEVGGDDGYKLFIDGKAVIDEWHEGAFRTKKYKLTLKAGEKHDVRIDYYQKGGSAAVNFTWNCLDGNYVDNSVTARLKKADAIVACIGFNATTEGEGFDRTFALPATDQALLKTMADSKKPVVAVLNSGGGVDMRTWEPTVRALLWAGYGGQESGTALAGILFGKVNPSGKLPMTFEKRWEDNPAYNTYYETDADKHVKYKEGVFIGYRGYDKLNREVQYPFGYGLSYTSFKLTGLTVGQVKADGTVDVTCTVTNTGRRAGAEVVQVYVGKNGTSPVERPQKELRSFDKVMLKAGESKTVTMTLPKESFMYFDTGTHRFVADEGQYNVMAGFSSRDIKAQQTVDWKM